jgi:hypothetical protein
VGWLFLLVAVVDWLALREGIAPHSPPLLAAIVAVAMIAFAVRFVSLITRLLSERGSRVTRGAELLLLLGLFLALSSGMANWVLSLQGFVILNEGEKVNLHGGSELQRFEAGPLAQVGEMDLEMRLDELELAPAGPDGFVPRSHVQLWQEQVESGKVTVEPRVSASWGQLRFHQGAFGFAPRIVILREDETVFDRVVPFTSRRVERAGVLFDGSFSIEREGLAVDGAVSLASLDEGMRGHATLELTVRRDGAVIGAGNLTPGRFAEIGQGFQIGFAGLSKWSEIVVSRRNYGGFVLSGGATALVGALLWPVAAWREW